MAGPLVIALAGTGTGVGKSRVMELLVPALRRRGRRVWLHKPVSCGDWDGASSEDGRRLRILADDGQDPRLICPREFPEPASPHLAAAACGRQVDMVGLRAALDACRGGEHDLLVEGAGGLFSPLCAGRETLADLCAAADLPLLIVTRPDLGTLHASSATVRAARACGLRLLGLVLNEAQPAGDSLAVRSAAIELPLCCGLPLLAELPHGAGPAAGDALAAALLG